jgi:hypothetical protein
VGLVKFDENMRKGAGTSLFGSKMLKGKKE